MPISSDQATWNHPVGFIDNGGLAMSAVLLAISRQRIRVPSMKMLVEHHKIDKMTGRCRRAGVAGRRTNRRGHATRESMLEAALRSLASGEPGSVSANRIAKEIGATWGAVQYQFGDTDGFWAAVLHRTAERRDATLSALDRRQPDAPLRERVGAIIDTLYHGLASPGFARDRKPAGRAAPRTPTSSNASTRAPPPSCSPGARAGWKPARTPSPISASTRSRVREVAALIPGAMRGLVSERQLGSYADLDDGPPRADQRPGNLSRAVASYVTHSGCCSVSTAEKSLCPSPAVQPPSTTNSEPVE